jgi:hypothetical protein
MTALLVTSLNKLKKIKACKNLKESNFVKLRRSSSSLAVFASTTTANNGIYPKSFRKAASSIGNSTWLLMLQ